MAVTFSVSYKRVLGRLIKFGKHSMSASLRYHQLVNKLAENWIGG
jgi:hypothetical protein